MPSNSKKWKSVNEMKVAARKRARSESGDEEDYYGESPILTDDEKNSPSDYEETNNKAKKKAKTSSAKRQKTEKHQATPAPAPVKKPAAPKLPKWAQSAEGVALFSVPWWKEVTAKDAFWIEFEKRVPRAVKAKRLSVNIATDLDVPVMKEEDGAVAASSKPKARSKKSAATAAGESAIKREQDRAKLLEKHEPSDDDSDAEMEILLMPGSDARESYEPLTRNSPKATIDSLPSAKEKSPKSLKASSNKHTKSHVEQPETVDDDEPVFISVQKSPKASNDKSDSTKAADAEHADAKATSKEPEAHISEGTTAPMQDDDTIVVTSSEPVEAATKPKETGKVSDETVLPSIEASESQSDSVDKVAENDMMEGEKV